MQTLFKKYNKNIYKLIKSIYAILNKDIDYTYSSLSAIRDNDQVISNNIKLYLLDNPYLPINVKRFIIEKNKTNRQYIHDYTIEVNGYVINLYLIDYKNHLSTKYCKQVCKNIADIFNLLHIITDNNYYKCNNGSINIFLYFTPFKRIITKLNKLELSAEHINGGFCYGCTNQQTICVYRKEDYFKTLIHELIHSFGVDKYLIENISNRDSIKYVNKIYNLTNNSLDNKFNYAINECYCEFWACIINCIYYTKCRYKRYKFNQYFIKFKQLLYQDIMHNVVQVVKILKINNLKYLNILNYDIINNYIESTHVISYYLLKTILLFNIDSIINNRNILENNNIENLNICFKISKYSITNLIDILYQNARNNDYKNLILAKEREYILKCYKNTHKNGKLYNKTKKYCNNLKMTSIKLL